MRLRCAGEWAEGRIIVPVIPGVVTNLLSWMQDRDSYNQGKWASLLIDCVNEIKKLTDAKIRTATFDFVKARPVTCTLDVAALHMEAGSINTEPVGQASSLPPLSPKLSDGRLEACPTDMIGASWLSKHPRFPITCNEVTYMNGWIIDDQTHSQGKRYELPAWPELAEGQEAIEAEGDEACFLLLRPLTDAEALERESIGIVEWYYLDGQEPAVRRTYDLAVMTEYDYRHCILDFRLPVRAVTCSGTHSGTHSEGVGEVGQVDAQVRLVAMDADDPEANLRLLQKMPPKLAEWVADCVADVNMRSPQWRYRLQEAKKN